MTAFQISFKIILYAKFMFLGHSGLVISMFAIPLAITASAVCLHDLPVLQGFPPYTKGMHCRLIDLSISHVVCKLYDFAMQWIGTISIESLG